MFSGRLSRPLATSPSVKPNLVAITKSLGTKDLKAAKVRATSVLMEFDRILAEAEALLVERPLRTSSRTVWTNSVKAAKLHTLTDQGRRIRRVRIACIQDDLARQRGPQPLAQGSKYSAGDHGAEYRRQQDGHDSIAHDARHVPTTPGAPDQLRLMNRLYLAAVLRPGRLAAQ
jgi:hypothetical protein